MAGESGKSIALYYCYDRKDRALHDALRSHLAALLQGQFTSWHAGEIKAGMEWQKEIADHLQTAEVILLLVSAHFLTSKDIYSEETRLALARHERNKALVIPILLRPVDLEGTPLSQLSALPSNGKPVTLWSNRDQAFLDIARGIRLALNELVERQKSHLDTASKNGNKDTFAFTNEQSAKDSVYQVTQSAFHFNTPLTDPKELYGRRRECMALLDRIYKNSATSIVGPRRIGKTWLMQYIKLVAPTRLGARFRIAYIDATSPRCTTIAGFVALVLEEMKITDPLASGELDLAYMEHTIKHMRASGHTLVLCIDEFEGLTSEETFDLRFFTNLRAIAQAGLVLVVASKHPLIQLVSDTLKTSPFFNIFEKLALKPFSAQEAEAFANAKSEEAYLSNRERELLLQYGQSGEQEWQPARLQLVGTLLLEEKILAEDPAYYRPDDPRYWREFEKRLEDKYQETGL